MRYIRDQLENITEIPKIVFP